MHRCHIHIIPLALITIVSAFAAPGAAQADSIIDPAKLAKKRHDHETTTS